ncbi:hypothetical protein DH2020_034114 [Rehmannia glutinosa]|uniref:Uncharacterized protein n=1 Tax=Rehmannia glutinosa TaxID=99300 RepID=A0ABR0VC33_REHGL
MTQAIGRIGQSSPHQTPPSFRFEPRSSSSPIATYSIDDSIDTTTSTSGAIPRYYVVLVEAHQKDPGGESDGQGGDAGQLIVAEDLFFIEFGFNFGGHELGFYRYNLAILGFEVKFAMRALVSPMVPSRMVGGIAQSSSSSGIFFQGDGQSQVAGNSQLSSNIGNSSHSVPRHARANMGPLSGDINNAVLNSVASSGPSVGASSLVTDANSGLSGGPHMQRSASFNTDSYMRLPASPLSFTSNNISISGSSIMDGSSVPQQSSNQDPGSQAQQSQQHQGASSATSLSTSRMGQVQLPGGPRVPNSFIQDPTTISQLQKKPRLDIKQEDILQQQVFQQMLQRQDPMSLQNPNPQLQALMQQQRLRQQQQRNSFFSLCRQCSEFRIKRPYDGGVCSRRVMQYLYHQRQRPAVETFCEHFVISHVLGLARTIQLPIGENLWLSITLHVQRRGGVYPYIILGILCARRHEELLPRRLVAPKVNELLQVAQKCQSTISESGPDGVSQPDLQANSVMVVTAGRQLARSLELQSLNDLGFSKRYIAEVVNSMKDLMDFSTEQKVGAIEGLKNFPRHPSAPKAQMPKMQETEQVGGPQGLPTDRNTLNKLMAMHPGINGSMNNNNQHLVGRGPITGSAQAALALTNYQNLLMRQNSMNSTHTNTSLQHEASSPYSTSSQNPTTPGPSGNLPTNLQNSPVSGFSSGQRQQLQQQNHQSLPSQGSQALQQQMIQQLLQDMSNKNNGTTVLTTVFCYAKSRWQYVEG